MPLFGVFPLADPRLRAYHLSYHVVLVNTVQVHAVRVPYKTLIEDYADKFFSDPVLCTMAENIDSLKGRDEHAMEKDVFQDPKYREHVKKLNKEKRAASLALGRRSTRTRTRRPNRHRRLRRRLLCC